MSSVDFRAAQAANKRRTVLLMAVMASLLAGLVWLFAWYNGTVSLGLVPIVVALTTVTTWASYYHSDRLVLKMTRAREVSAEQAPQLHNLVEEVALAAGLPKPRIAIVEDDAPNAFATGRDPDHALIAYTRGILERMDRDQLQGVTAHEMSHIANRDTLVATVAATTAGAIALIADLMLRLTYFGGSSSRRRSSENSNAGVVLLLAMLVGAVLAPLAATVLRAAVSRRRETLADATAVALTRNPAGLRRALEALDADSTVVAARSNAVAHLWIESPLDNRVTSRLFRTHPPIGERIAALRAMEGNG